MKTPTPEHVWHTDKVDDAHTFIMNGPLVVGSIVRDADGRWNVEVLWSGSKGDITFSGADYATALAFVEGVRKTVEAIGDA